MEYAVAIHTGLVWHVGHHRSLQDALKHFETCVSPQKRIVSRETPSAPWTPMSDDLDEPCS